MQVGRLMGGALFGACVLVGGAVAAQEMEGASFELPLEVVSAATAFQQYMASAAHIDAGFGNGVEVARGLKAGASYEPGQLEEGMIGYGAMAALQDDGFVAGVRQAAGRGEERTAFAERLIEDPFAATRIDGAAAAVKRIEAALAAESAPLIAAATSVKQAAYSVQHQAWSKASVADAEARLKDVKGWSVLRAFPSEGDNQATMAKVADVAPADGEAAGGFTAIEARALALAAEAALGRAGGSERDRLSPLLSEADSAQCLKMAKLNLYQCMAVAGPQYEDIYCLGQHAMLDTGQCVGHAARDAGPATSATQLAERGGVSPRPGRYALRIRAD